jgi:hypothetical protein
MTLAGPLRRAVSAGRFAEAQALLLEYRRMLDAVPPGAPERERMFGEAAELVEWTRRITLAERAACAARLASLAAAPAPYRAGEPARHSWEMVG